MSCIPSEAAGIGECGICSPTASGRLAAPARRLRSPGVSGASSRDTGGRVTSRRGGRDELKPTPRPRTDSAAPSVAQCHQLRRRRRRRRRLAS